MATPANLQQAVAQGIITEQQREAILRLAIGQPADAGVARFRFTHVLYYLGGLIAIGALSLFMTLAWERMGASALLATALSYGVAAYGGAALLERRGHGIPAGILATIVVVLVPLAVYALQHMMGFWVDAPHAKAYRDFHYYIDWRWILMELATLAAGAAMLWRFRYPFLLMPVAIVLWYMGMDLAPMLAGTNDLWSPKVWELRKWIAIAMGLAALALAAVVDLRTRSPRDYAFWLYLSGLMSFWGGLTMLGSHGLQGKLLYLAINVGLVLAGAILGRRTFAVFGGIGVATALANLSWTYFSGSFGFTIALTFIGLAIVGLGIVWQRNEERIAGGLRRLLPEALQRRLDERIAHAA